MLHVEPDDRSAGGQNQEPSDPPPTSREWKAIHAAPPPGRLGAMPSGSRDRSAAIMAVAAGAQTERRGVPRPVRLPLGGEDAPADCLSSRSRSDNSPRLSAAALDHTQRSLSCYARVPSDRITHHGVDF